MALRRPCSWLARRFISPPSRRRSGMAPSNRPLRVMSASAAAASLVALARPAFVAVQGLTTSRRMQAASSSVQPLPEQPPVAAASPAGAGAVAGTWAAAACLGVAASRRPARTSRKFFGGDKAEEKKVEKMEAKEAFDAFKPDTYGNLTMDDVKKYGVAGTLSYVITELVFWALAFPTEFAIFWKIEGRWPDLAIDTDKATVFGFVFAAANIARACLPLRFGAALAIAPWVDENIVQPFQKGEKKAESN
mmetsp:Transcript_50074/g.132349  ORF Transcript_50074/g.132349 Transcript_50074/m.132349 type:complete len:249 (+) Transcript_50074:13-759(+)